MTKAELQKAREICRRRDCENCMFVDCNIDDVSSAEYTEQQRRDRDALVDRLDKRKLHRRRVSRLRWAAKEKSCKETPQRTEAERTAALERARRYRLRHLDYYSALRKERHFAHRDEELAAAKKWRRKNSEHVADYKARYRAEHADEIREYNRKYSNAYYHKNRKKLLAARKAYAKARWREVGAAVNAAKRKGVCAECFDKSECPGRANCPTYMKYGLRKPRKHNG